MLPPSVGRPSSAASPAGPSYSPACSPASTREEVCPINLAQVDQCVPSRGTSKHSGSSMPHRARIILSRLHRHDLLFRFSLSTRPNPSSSSGLSNPQRRGQFRLAAARACVNDIPQARGDLPTPSPTTPEEVCLIFPFTHSKRSVPSSPSCTLVCLPPRLTHHSVSRDAAPRVVYSTEVCPFTLAGMDP